MKKFLVLINSELSLKGYCIVLVSLGLVLFLFYGETIQNGYNLDDEVIYTSNNKTTEGLKHVKEIFTKNSFDYQDTSYEYRPIALLSFSIENHFFGINAKASHTINLLIYLLTSFVFFKILTSLLPDEKVKYSFWTALLFLVLPIHSEIINNVKCRDELLMLLFGLLATYYWIKSNSKGYYGMLSIILLTISILSKKSGFIFLGIIPFVSYYSNGGTWRKGLKSLLFMIIPVVLFKLTVRYIKGKKGNRIYSAFENPQFETEMIYNKAVMVFESTWFYFKNMLFPTQFVSYYGLKTIEIQEFELGSALAITLLLALIYLALKGLQKRKIYALGVIIILGGILPFVNLIMPMVGIVAERFVTIASIGLCILLVFGAKELLTKKKKYGTYAVVCLLLYAVAYLPLLKARNSEWSSELKLLKADIEKEPNSFQLNYMLASNYFFQLSEVKDAKRRTTMAKKSLDYYNKTIELIPTKEVYNERGTLLLKAYRNTKAAEESYLKALELDTNFTIVQYNLGTLYYESGQTQKSINRLIQFVKHDSSKQKAYRLLTMQLAQAKRYEEAMKWANHGLKYSPNDAELMVNKANIYYSAGENDNALKTYEKVLKELDANHPTAIEMVKRLNSQTVQKTVN